MNSWFVKRHLLFSEFYGSQVKYTIPCHIQGISCLADGFFNQFFPDFNPCYYL